MTALIPLYWRGHYVMDALVDDEDWPVLRHYRWYAAPIHRMTREIGYASARIDGVQIKMDRLVMGVPARDRRVVHHRNQVKFDNRKENLFVFGDEHSHQMCDEHKRPMLERLRIGQRAVRAARESAGLPPFRFYPHRDLRAIRAAAERTWLLG